MKRNTTTPLDLTPKTSKYFWRKLPGSLDSDCALIESQRTLTLITFLKNHRNLFTDYVDLTLDDVLKSASITWAMVLT